MLRVGLVGGERAAEVGRRLHELGGGETGEIVVSDASGGGCRHLLVGVAGEGDGADADVLLDGGRLVAAVDELWRERLVPFEANVRTGKRAPRRQRAVLVEPDPTWPGQAARLIGRLREAVGEAALRIDHIGSTSVPGLPAKDLVDIQVAVGSLAVARRAAEGARDAGFVHVGGAWFGTDRSGAEHPEEVLVDADPGRPVNVNIRPVTAPVWRDALLFRDWLRTHPRERDAYAAVKLDLAGREGPDVDAYSRDKMPWIRAALVRAETWRAATGWAPAVPVPTDPPAGAPQDLSEGQHDRGVDDRAALRVGSPASDSDGTGPV